MVYHQNLSLGIEIQSDYYKVKITGYTQEKESQKAFA